MMKCNLYVQYEGADISEDEMIDQVKKYWKQDGHKIRDIETLDLYVKPEDRTVYYSVNQDEQKGTIQF